jgi:hypothetical protein
MASTPSSASQLTQIKTRLKTWERQFKAIEGRAPNKADIKANPEIGMYALEYQEWFARRNGLETDVHLSNSENVFHLQLVPQRLEGIRRPSKFLIITFE